MKNVFLENYQQVSNGFASKKFNMYKLPAGQAGIDVIHAVQGISSEAGELNDHLKRVLFYDKDTIVFDPINVVEECGDLLWYIALLLTAVGSTFEEAMTKNTAKLTERNKGKTFNADTTVNRDTDAERKILEGQTESAGEDNSTIQDITQEERNDVPDHLDPGANH